MLKILSFTRKKFFSVLCQVDISLPVGVRPLDVLPLNQSFYSLLDDDWRRLEPGAQLLHNLSDQLIVVALLPALHDSDDACFNLMFPVFVHLLFRLTSFRLGLPQPSAGLLHLDPVELRREGIVDLEGVRRLNLLSLWVLDQDSLAGFANGKRLERSDQLSVRDGGLVFDLLIGEGLSLVEQKEQTHLELDQVELLVKLKKTKGKGWLV